MGERNFAGLSRSSRNNPRWSRAVFCSQVMAPPTLGRWWLFTICQGSLEPFGNSTDIESTRVGVLTERERGLGQPDASQPAVHEFSLGWVFSRLFDITPALHEVEHFQQLIRVPAVSFEERFGCV